MRIDRLMILLDHMEQPKGFHKVFDFSCFNGNGEKHYVPNVCGTNGCMAGELPGIWPEYWEFCKSGIGLKYICLNNSEGLAFFFDINETEVGHLFYPNGQDIENYGGIKLGYNATKEQVTYNLRIFIERALDNGATV